jgi:hypothetical protein
VGERTRKPRSSRNRRLALIEMKTGDEVTQQWANHLSHGGAYGPSGGKQDAVVTLMLVGPAAMPFMLPAKTVYVGDDGTGYEITGFGPALKKELAAWVKANASPDADDHAPTTKMMKLTRTKK